VTSSTNDEVVAAEMPEKGMDGHSAETETRPDLLWDNEVPSLCVRVYGNGSKSFFFVYRMNDRQRLLRIGKTPMWSVEAARNWAKELREVVNQGGDPESYNRDCHKVGPVENVIQYIAEQLGRTP
jgi:Arm DNA-binding domain